MNTTTHNTLSDILYLLVLGLYLIIAVTSDSFYRMSLPKGNRMNAVLFVLLLILVVRELAFGMYSARTWILLAAALLFVGNAMISGTFFLAFPFLLIYCGRDVSPRLLFTFAGIMTCALLFFVIGSSFVGIIPNYTRREMDRSHREFLGFLFALYPGTLFFNAAALILAVRGRRVRFVTLAAAAFISVWIYTRTNGRLACGLTLLLVAAFAAAKLWPGLIRFMRPVMALVVPAFPICAAVSLALTFGYNSTVPWMAKVNRILGKRLFRGKTSLERFGAGLFGREVHWVGYGLNERGKRAAGAYLYVDNLYVNFLQRFGWIALIAALGLLTWAMARIYRAKRYELLIVFAILALHSLIDDRILLLGYNTFWIAAAHAIARGGPPREDWDYESIA